MNCRENERQRQCRLFQEILYTRQKTLLNSSSGRTNEDSSEDDVKKNGVSEFNHKVAKRYFSELNIIRREAGESSNSSDDENYPGNLTLN